MEATELGKKMLRKFSLENEYRKRFIEDDLIIFPNFWFGLDDIDFKITALELALKENKKLKELEEVKKISNLINASKAYTNMESYRKK